MKLAQKIIKLVEEYSMDSMSDLAAHLRCMQLLAHNGHNLTYGETFLQDHDYLGSLYPAYTTAYDGVIENCMGEMEDPDLVEVQVIAVEKLQEIGAVATPYSELYDLEVELQEKIKIVLDGASEGSKQFLGDLAKDSITRCYKLKQLLS